jgi:signal transduction histidine kinase
MEHVAARKIIRVTVQDSGIGVAPQDQLKIFNKFEQVHGARQTVKGPKGTGLGLSICRALVELHGGSLGVESRPGEGSTFFFMLPVEPHPPSGQTLFAGAGRGEASIKGRSS